MEQDLSREFLKVVEEGAIAAKNWWTPRMPRP